MKSKEEMMIRKHSLGAKPVQGPIAQVLQFPSNPEEIQYLLSKEEILEEDLYKHETYEERVETRKELKKVREELSAKIKNAQ